MTLCDAGPLVAMVDRRDVHHARCIEALESMPEGEMVTTWPCLTEAMYLVRRAAGARGQEVLWGYLQDGLLGLYPSKADEWPRMRALMREYGDTPMDFADASLVTAAERLGTHQVFTLDKHFRAYRIHGRHAFEVVPG